MILPDKTQRAVKRALDRLERRHGSQFKEKFKTITTDNGSEFLDPTAVGNAEVTRMQMA
jgi:IS30 family transposase